MLIQDLGGRLRLLPQHEHGLLAGELAAAWREPDGGGTLPEEVVLATALHDLAWVELDAEPRWNPETRRPHDFLDFPAPPKYEAAADAIERVSELHPYAGVLVSLHYCAFGSPDRPAEFEEVEDERRMELLAELEEEAPGPARIRRDWARLRLFDNLSLFLCLTPPGADPASRPPWLTPDLLAVPGEGTALELTWRDGDRALLSPWPFEPASLELEVGYRELVGSAWDSPDELGRAWRRAGEETWRLRLEEETG